MFVRVLSIILVIVVLLTGWTLSLIAAGCNCDSTCDSLLLCFEIGDGECHEGYEHSCHDGACGSWAIWRLDCFVQCTWTRYQCLTKQCDLAVSQSWCTL